MTSLKKHTIISLLGCVFFITGCRKTESIFTAVKEADAATLFFHLPATATPETKRVATHLQQIGLANPGFISRLAKQEGFAVWDKVMIKPTASAITRTSAPGTSVDTIMYIPLVIDSDDHVDAFIYAVLNSSIQLRLYRASDYSRYGYGSIEVATGNAERLALQFMMLDNSVFGHTRFTLLDDSLFRAPTINHPHINRINRILQIKVPDNATATGMTSRSAGYWQQGTVTHCTYTTAYHCTGDLVCQPNCDNCELCITTGYSCETTFEYYFIPGDDDGNLGNGGEGSGGGDNTDGVEMGAIPCNPTALIDNGLLPCPAGNTTGWIPFVPAELEDIDDTQVTDSCIRALIQEIGKPGHNAYILKVYDSARYATHNVKQKYRLKYDIDSSLTGNSGQSVPARTYMEKLADGTAQVEITLNTSFFRYTSKEWVTAVILHEFAHGILMVERPQDSTNYLSHMHMFDNFYPGSILFSLKELFPALDDHDGLALGMDGLSDAYSIKKPNGTDSIDRYKDTFSIKYYGQHIADAITAAYVFRNGMRGTPFCR